MISFLTLSVYCWRDALGSIFDMATRPRDVLPTDVPAHNGPHLHLARTLHALPDMQYGLTKATDKMIRYVWRENLVQIVKRGRRDTRNLVGGSMLRPSPARLQPSLTFVIHIHRPITRRNDLGVWGRPSAEVTRTFAEGVRAGASKNGGCTRPAKHDLSGGIIVPWGN